MASNKPRCTDITWERRADCKRCMIRSKVLFADVPAAMLDKLLGPIDQLVYAPGATLYDLGANDEALYTLRSGAVKLLQFLPNGDQRVVRLLRQGDVAGLERVLGAPCRHAAIALNEVHACRVPLDVVRDLQRRDHVIHDQLLQRWQRSVEEADHFITYLSTGSAQARLARLLLLLSEYERDGAPIPLNREDMGSITGVSMETASRVMAEFKRRCWLRENGGRIEVLDRVALEHVAVD